MRTDLAPRRTQSQNSLPENARQCQRPQMPPTRILLLPDELCSCESTAVAGAAIAGSGVLYAQSRTDTEPRTLDGQPVPEPPADKSAGPVKPGRGSALGGKVAVVTGAARGIGRAIAVEFAANGADVVLIDIAGPVSDGQRRQTRNPADLEETLRQVKVACTQRRNDPVGHSRSGRAAQGRRSDRYYLRENRYRRRQRCDSALEVLARDAGCGMA